VPPLDLAVIEAADDHHMKLRIGAYLTVLGWYLLAFVALTGWVYWEAVQAGPFAGLVIEGLGALVVFWLGTGAATGWTLVGRWMDRTEPTTLSRSFRLGTAAAGMGSLIGLAALAVLCPIAYGLAYVQHLLR
jgi:hypothetical protein